MSSYENFFHGRFPPSLISHLGSRSTSSGPPPYDALNNTYFEMYDEFFPRLKATPAVIATFVHPQQLMDKYKKIFYFYEYKRLVHHSMPFIYHLPHMLSLTVGGVVKKQLVRRGNGRPVIEGHMLLIQFEAFHEGAENPFRSTVQSNKPEKVVLSRRHDVMDEIMFTILSSMKEREASRFMIQQDCECNDLLRTHSYLMEIRVLAILDSVEIINEKLELRFVNSSPKCMIRNVQNRCAQGAKLFRNGDVQGAIATHLYCLRLLQGTARPSCDSAVLRSVTMTVLNNLASNYWAAGLYSKVYRACIRVLRMDIKNREALKLAANSLFRAGHYRAAKEVFEFALNHYPTYAELRADNQRLSEIMDSTDEFLI